MSGFTKHKCENDTFEAKKDIAKYLKVIAPLLPYEYDFEIVKSVLQRYYPFELLIISQKEKYYRDKERSLIKHKKSRFTMFVSLDTMIKESNEYKKIMSLDYIQKRQVTFNELLVEKSNHEFSVQRDPKIIKRHTKIKKALDKTQQVEPEFLDALMGLYDRKNTSQKDKVYILIELEKYYCDKVLRFFSKVIDTELNRQLREMAFSHFQSLGFQPTLRNQKYFVVKTNNKKRKTYLKKVYPYEKSNINAIPSELEYRIENNKEQKIKTYDYFISHSSADFENVQALIKELNKKGENVYCDWINDTDYLKRHLVGNATLSVILKRIAQSKEVIFVVSDNSLKSNWCKYELNDIKKANKRLLFINNSDISNGCFDLKEYTDIWYVDENYKSLKLF